MLVDDLAALLGPNGWLADASGHSRDWLDRYGTPPLGVARPATTVEVSAVVALCHAAGVAVVPQGGNTGLCGGAVAGEAGGVILSLSRMAQIGPVDPDSASIVVDAGVVLADLHQRLEGSGLIFPLHLGAEGSARIGGLIGTNAGGSQAFRHGMMGDRVLGLEVVLPDGAVWDGLRAVQKDNAGFQLRRLFCGAEGALGVVTRAVLQLAPAPRQQATALLAVPGWEALVQLGRLLRSEAGEFLAAIEFFCEFGLTLAERHVAGLVFPLQSRAPVYLLVELATTAPRVALDDIFADLLEAGMTAGLISDGALAMSEAQRAMFWRLREEQPEGQRLTGPQLKHDISVPPGRIADFLAAARTCCEAHQSGIRINPFGHLGDGNIHYNLSPPEGTGFAFEAAALAREIAQLAQGMAGSFAAEHGLGRAKVALADAMRGPVERGLMAAIKAAIDPAGGMNPGVLLRANRKDNIS